MRIGTPAWVGAPWPVQKKTSMGWTTIGRFTTEAEAQDFIDAKASEVTS